MLLAEDRMHHSSKSFITNHNKKSNNILHLFFFVDQFLAHCTICDGCSDLACITLSRIGIDVRMYDVHEMGTHQWPLGEYLPGAVIKDDAFLWVIEVRRFAQMRANCIAMVTDLNFLSVYPGHVSLYFICNEIVIKKIEIIDYSQEINSQLFMLMSGWDTCCRVSIDEMLHSNLLLLGLQWEGAALLLLHLGGMWHGDT